MSQAQHTKKSLERGLRLHQSGKLDEAGLIYRQVLDQNPGNADALHFLGLIAQQKGDAALAIDLISDAIEIEEPRPTFHFNLAAARLAAGDAAGALNSYRRAAELKPDFDDAHYSIGALLGRSGRAEEALVALDRALELKPDFGEALCAKGAALERLGRSAAAAAACRGALEIDPKMAEAWTNLGNALQSLGQMEDAEKAQREAIRLNPDYATAQYNLGNLLSDLWRAAEACECFRRALDLDPDDASARGNHLMNLLYDEAIDEAQLFEEHTRWAPAVSSRRKRNYAIHPDPDRRLRIGYVSPDFRTHSCAYFLEPLFANHNDESVETFAYSGVQRPDGVTARLRTLVHNWRDIHDLDDGAAAETVIGDKIDILVDLAGYSRGGRPGLFQSRPAPVQVTWLGYPATTGIAAIDYRLSDAIADPEGDADAHHVEKLVRLAGGFHCYQPPSSAPEIKPPPALNNGFITFASFNNISKISPDVVAAWARLLSSAPDSRLMLKGKGFDYPQLGERMMAAFEAQGIARERLELLPWIARSDNPISLYERVDIALDTFPYNGTTTTLEALWMGVPVITLAGRRHAARVGASLLTHAGWPELVASDVGGYVECAAALARAPNRLADFRSTARAQLKASPLMDAPGFALKIEAMYGDIWRYWCAAQ